MKNPLCTAAVLLVLATSAQAAVLTGLSNTNPATGVNLTTTGSLDWAVWTIAGTSGAGPSLAPNNTKSGGPVIFSGITPVNGGVNVRGYGSATQTFTYTDGTSPASLTGGTLGLAANSVLDEVGTGVALSITGNPSQTYEINIWTAGYNAIGELTATLDGATPVVLSSRSWGTTKTPSLFTITFRPDEVTDLLNLSFVLATDSGANAHVGIQAISVTAVPEPSAGVLVLGGLAFVVASCRARTRRIL